MWKFFGRGRQLADLLIHSATDFGFDVADFWALVCRVVSVVRFDFLSEVFSTTSGGLRVFSGVFGGSGLRSGGCGTFFGIGGGGSGGAGTCAWDSDGSRVFAGGSRTFPCGSGGCWTCAFTSSCPWICLGFSSFPPYAPMRASSASDSDFLPTAFSLSSLSPALLCWGFGSCLTSRTKP